MLLYVPIIVKITVVNMYHFDIPCRGEAVPRPSSRNAGRIPNYQRRCGRAGEAPPRPVLHGAGIRCKHKKGARRSVPLEESPLLPANHFFTVKTTWAAYFTVNVAVDLTVCEPETPVKVMR